MNLLVLLLIALPACLAQFSIQGPSDGNRVAQGLRIEEGKGIEYTDQNEPQSGGFSIQGASDGSAQIQGASDGHSNFQIQGAHHGGADRYNFQGPVTGAYNIQGATDGHSQSIIQGAYDGNSGSSKSLQYNDPSGLRVNWKSYDRPTRPEAQQEAQYSQAPIQRAAPQQRAHAQRQPQPPPQPEPVAIQQARGLDSAPMQIKQLLQLQQQLPYINIIPEPFRYESLLAAQANQQQHQPQYQSEVQEQPVSEGRRPTYRGKPSGPPRHRRQAPQYRQEAAAGQQQQYSKVPQPPVESQIKYSPNLPPQLEQLLKFQQQTPYINSIPEPFRFNPEPYAQMQLQQFRSHYDDLLRQQPASPVVHTVEPAKAPPPARGPPRSSESEHSRQRRQAPHRGQQQSQHPRPQPLPAEPAPQYSTNLPSSLQSLLKYQSQIPYNIIANQINYRPEKPYVPQPVQQPQQAHYQPQQAEYQPQQAEYEPQQAHYQPQQAQYQPQQAQYQPQQAQYQPQQAHYQPQQAQYQPQYQPQQAQYQPQQAQYQQTQYQGHGDVYQGQSSIYNQVSQIIQQQQADAGVRPVKEN
ncbi:unnamed protein product [Xylocopa violacea]|uniref:Uncharacterized protein n=1 Tax=Xylocopa violacea TaxID=135666 RepID=A0ABP1NUK7_XYLVO